MQAYFGSLVSKQIYLETVCADRRYSRTLFDFFQSGYFFFTFDLKPGYHHVEIFLDHRQYLGFSWNFSLVVKYFVFTVLPSGMSSAPYIFSKLVRSLVNCWRGLGRRVVTFLDDAIGRSPDYASCLVHSRLCRSDLDPAGFFVNLQKSVWEPSQVGTWLGFHLDFSLDFITVPLPKITKLQESISRILALRLVNTKDLASVAGQLNSMFFDYWKRCVFNVSCHVRPDISSEVLVF